MVRTLANLNWGRIVGASAGAFVGSTLVTMLIVMVYAFMLGFEVRGQPDQAQIQAFARLIGPSFGPVLLSFFTGIAALWAGRNGLRTVEQGLMVGGIAAAAGLVPSWPIDLRDVSMFGAIVGAGCVGGFVAGLVNQPDPGSEP